MKTKTPLLVKISLLILTPCVFIFFSPFIFLFGIKKYYHFWIDELIKELK